MSPKSMGVCELVWESVHEVNPFQAEFLGLHHQARSESSPRGEAFYQALLVSATNDSPAIHLALSTM